MRRDATSHPWGAADGRVRVLIECDASSDPEIIASVVERHGYDVRTCDGPEAHPCELLERGACSLVDGADVVVNMLHGPGGTDAAAVLPTVRAVGRPPAIVAERRGLGADPGRADEDDHTLAPVTVVQGPVSTASLLASIERALHGSD